MYICASFPNDYTELCNSFFVLVIKNCTLKMIYGDTKLVSFLYFYTTSLLVLVLQFLSILLLFDYILYFSTILLNRFLGSSFYEF